MSGPIRMPLDLVIALALMAAAWGFAGYLGFTLLSPNGDLGMQLAALLMAAVYQVAAFMLAARARTGR